MSTTYIESGTSIRVYDSAVQAHDELPLGTYVVRFSPLTGYSLQRCENLDVGGEKVYGDRNRKVTKIFRTYSNSTRSLGTMLSGDKGQGKSLFLRMMAEHAYSIGLPVVRVTEDSDGLADFIDTLGECMVVFDEFEKIFSAGPRGADSSDGNRQNQFLSLFDGMSSTKRLYCLSINEISHVSSYLVNRPGRFHYHMRFDYPGPEQVREYLRDQAPSAAKSAIDSVVNFASKTNLNYDHLRAIAFELESDVEATFAELITDLNIKMVQSTTYRITATYGDGSTLTGTDTFNLFPSDAGERDILSLSNSAHGIYAGFLLADVVQDNQGNLSLPIEALIVDPDDRDDEDPDPRKELPVHIGLSLVGQRTIDYAAL